MGIKNLNKLIKNMNPSLSDKEFVFIASKVPLKLNSILVFQEKEGTTYIIKKEQAENKKFSYNSVWRMITLNINSDLEAVGFLAKITEALAEKEISVNAVSAFYHDHLFVPANKAKKAMEILRKLSR